MGDSLRPLIERIRKLGPADVDSAQRFIDGWNQFKLRFVPGFPEDKLWVNFVANHPERARLLGVTVNPRQHWPFVTLRCPSPCPLCDRPEKDAQRIREEVERVEVREREEQARALAAARRQEDERALREAEVLQEREKLTAEHGRRFDHLEKVSETKKGFRKKEERKQTENYEQFQKEVDRNPRLGEAVLRTQKFLAGWGPSLDKHEGIPEGKLWLAYVANDPRGAIGIGAAVSLAEHLPQVVNGCLTPCRICDESQPLEVRKERWAKTQQLLEQAARAREKREQEAAAEAAKVQAEVAKKKRERKAEARARRRAEREAARSEEEAGEWVRPAWLEEEIRSYNEWYTTHKERSEEEWDAIYAELTDPNRSIDALALGNQGGSCRWKLGDSGLRGIKRSCVPGSRARKSLGAEARKGLRLGRWFSRWGVVSSPRGGGKTLLGKWRQPGESMGSSGSRERRERA